MISIPDFDKCWSHTTASPVTSNRHELGNK